MMTSAMTIRQTTSTLLTAAILTAAGGCQGKPEPAPKPGWKITDARFMEDEGSCCNGPAAVVFGLFAAGDLAMDGNSLKIAVGCRQEGGGSVMASMLELKVRDRFGATEPFENARLDHVRDCRDPLSLLEAAAGIYELVREPSAVSEVAGANDATLCATIASPPGTVSIALMMRTLEEIAQRRLKICVSKVERLAVEAGPEVAVRAIATLGRIGDKRSIMTLGRLTLAPDLRIPWASAHAIADIGGLDALKALDIIAGQAQTTPLGLEAAELADQLRQEIR
jgi:hypothetical protein